MAVFYNLAMAVMWLSWSVYWWILSRNVKVTVHEESVYSRLSYTLPILVASILLFMPEFPVAGLNGHFLPVSAWRIYGGIGVALTFAGLLFTVWARIHLGKNWSIVVTLKENHELITSGPYQFVRHPIYTGLLLAFVGVAVARAEWCGILGVAIMALAIWRKLRKEEHVMLAQFGSTYQDYSKRVAALIPFVL